MQEGGGVTARWLCILIMLVLSCAQPRTSCAQQSSSEGAISPQGIRRKVAHSQSVHGVALESHANDGTRGTGRPFRGCRDVIVGEAVEVLWVADVQSRGAWHDGEVSQSPLVL